VEADRAQGGREGKNEAAATAPSARFLPLLSLLPHRRRRLYARAPRRGLPSLHPWPVGGGRVPVPTYVLPGGGGGGGRGPPRGGGGGGPPPPPPGGGGGGGGGGGSYASPLAMDAGVEKCGDAAAEGGGDLYAVLGLKKECSDADLKVAYRKLAKVRATRFLISRLSAPRYLLLAAAYRC
jgi:hypothetical protein